MRSELGRGMNTILFGSKEEQLNNARALVEYLGRAPPDPLEPARQESTFRDSLSRDHSIPSGRPRRTMQTFLATALIFGLAMVAMAVGVIFSDRRLQGSCGGTGRECSCDEEARRDCALAGQHGAD